MRLCATSACETASKPNGSRQGFARRGTSDRFWLLQRCEAAPVIALCRVADGDARPQSAARSRPSVAARRPTPLHHPPCSWSIQIVFCDGRTTRWASVAADIKYYPRKSEVAAQQRRAIYHDGTTHFAYGTSCRSTVCGQQHSHSKSPLANWDVAPNHRLFWKSVLVVCFFFVSCAFSFISCLNAILPAHSGSHSCGILMATLAALSPAPTPRRLSAPSKLVSAPALGARWRVVSTKYFLASRVLSFSVQPRGDLGCYCASPHGPTGVIYGAARSGRALAATRLEPLLFLAMV